jgi:hypothetical protein
LHHMRSLIIVPTEAPQVSHLPQAERHHHPQQETPAYSIAVSKATPYHQAIVTLVNCMASLILVFAYYTPIHGIMHYEK